jgi:hypothetical protein
MVLPSAREREYLRKSGTMSEDSRLVVENKRVDGKCHILTPQNTPRSLHRKDSLIKVSTELVSEDQILESGGVSMMFDGVDM